MQNKTETIVTQLHPIEIRTLSVFRKIRPAYMSELKQASGLREAQLRMALEWLQLKELIVISAERNDIWVSLTDAARSLKNGKLLETQILELLAGQDTLSIADLAIALGVDQKSANTAAGHLKKAAMADILPGGRISAAKMDGHTEIIARQHLLDRLNKTGRERKDAFDAPAWRTIEKASRKRGTAKGLFRITEIADKQFELTAQGEAVGASIAEQGLTGEEISQVTPQMLRDGSWKTGSFRAYALETPFARILAGKKNPYRQFLDFVKRKMVALGFEEMRGPIVESEFWNMDALYMPQFHAARDIHDAYYVKTPTHCQSIPEPNFSNVADTHSAGGHSGSRGWRYAFDKKRSRRLVLRSQGTALSARKLAGLPNIPGKYFSIARCFRYDAVDSTHAPDFFQVEGIVLGEEINFRHLIGLLKLFAKELARSQEVKFVPDYFPFTEPSVEVDIKHPKLGWVELGGAGIFRPEVTAPHGIDVPVIAWGLGLDRMAMVALEFDDIRDLFCTDLERIRSQRVHYDI